MLRNGLELPYVERGDADGVPFLLLHAWLDSRRYFDQLLAALPERIHAFAFDQRGHGDATKPAMATSWANSPTTSGRSWMRSDSTPPCSQAHPAVGYVAQRFAIDDPGRTLGLALLGSPRRLRGPRPAFAEVVATLEDPIDSVFVRELHEGMLGRELPDEIMQLLCEENLKMPAHVWRDAFEGLLAAEAPLDTGPISAPTLIGWGAHDSLFPRADQEAMAAQIPDARLGDLRRRRRPAGDRGARARRRRPPHPMRRRRGALNRSRARRRRRR